MKNTFLIRLHLVVRRIDGHDLELNINAIAVLESADIVLSYTA
jgi:hypothetical protein